MRGEGRRGGRRAARRVGAGGAPPPVGRPPPRRPAAQQSGIGEASRLPGAVGWGKPGRARWPAGGSGRGCRGAQARPAPLPTLPGFIQRTGKGSPARVAPQRQAPHPSKPPAWPIGPRTCVTVPLAVSAAAAGSAANLLTCCSAAGSAAAAAAAWTGTSPFERAASMMANLQWPLQGARRSG